MDAATKVCPTCGPYYPRADGLNSGCNNPERMDRS